MCSSSSDFFFTFSSLNLCKHRISIFFPNCKVVLFGRNVKGKMFHHYCVFTAYLLSMTFICNYKLVLNIAAIYINQYWLILI